MEYAGLQLEKYWSATRKIFGKTSSKIDRKIFPPESYNYFLIKQIKKNI